jgi:hypothetical protein
MFIKKTKGNKILRCKNMLDLVFGPYIHLLAKYKPLLPKMGLDNSLTQ